MTRVIAFCIVVVFIIHLLTCCWVLASSFDENSNWKTLWTTRQGGYGLTESWSNADTYGIALYYVVTTVTTVGYGDLSAVN